MGMSKEKLLEAVQALPPDFDFEDFLERMILLEKIEKGIKSADAGQTKTHAEVKAIVKSWQK